VRTGTCLFDNRTHEIRPEHVMAKRLAAARLSRPDRDRGEHDWDGQPGSSEHAACRGGQSTARPGSRSPFQVDLWTARAGSFQATRAVRDHGRTEGRYSPRARTRQRRTSSSICKNCDARWRISGKATRGPESEEEARMLHSSAGSQGLQVSALIYRSKHYEGNGRITNFAT